MRMPFRIVPVLAVAYVAVEVVSMIVVAKAVGALAMLLLLIVAMVSGFALLRRNGLGAIGEIRAEVDGGRAPAAAFADRALVFIAGLLLVVPGFFSDVFALVLLVPAVRASIYNAFATRFRTSFDATFARAAPRRPNGGPRSATLVIEGEIGVDGPRRG
ncbi:MAG: FxsA family protein [Bauldia sp.]|nr:FxsA family protein [Bauldia sp.]